LPNPDETTAHVPIEANAVRNPILPADPSYFDTSNVAISHPTELAPDTSTAEANDIAVNHNPNIVNDNLVSSSNVEEENNWCDDRRARLQVHLLATLLSKTQLNRTILVCC
jgi:hypothetical protein